jgi:hypothetical protein
MLSPFETAKSPVHVPVKSAAHADVALRANIKDAQKHKKFFIDESSY